MKMSTLLLNGGPNTENLLSYILDGLPGEESDQIEIRRTFEPLNGLGSEPITATAIITLATVSVPLVTRLIERWMENRRQKDVMTIVANGFTKSDEAGKALAHLAETNAKISVAYSLTKAEAGKAR